MERRNTMRKRIVLFGTFVLLLFGFSLQAEAITPGPPPPPAFSCGKMTCFRSSEHWLLRVDNLPGGVVYVGGANMNAPLSTDSHNAMWIALRGNQMGSSTPTQKLNQDFVAFQVSLMFNHGGSGSPAYIEALATQLGCYGFTNTVVLSNGATLSPQSTLRDLFDQVRYAFREYRSTDYISLWSFLIRLNTDIPNQVFCESKVDPGMYCCQEALQGADGLISGSDCIPITLAEQARCTGYYFSCTGETLSPAGLAKCKLAP
jgi:hypothetical protein